jgi:hypothetical protein
MKKTLLYFLAATVGLAMLAPAVSGCGNTESKANATTKAETGTTIVAYKIDQEPKLDGTADEAVWRNIKATTITVSDGRKVEVKFAYKGDNIFMNAVWPGSPGSGALKQWEWDGAKWTKPYGCYPTIGLVWPINDSIKGFNERGCGAICHNQGDRATWRMATDDLNARADMWDISVSYARVTGLANDFNLKAGNTWINQTIERSRKEASVGPDSSIETGPFIINGNDIPVYRLKDGLAITDVPYPTEAQLTPITDYSVFAKGDRLPYFIVDQTKIDDGVIYGGSRDDIKVGATWTGEKWSVELKRKLNTGHADDVQFSPESGHSYIFTLGVKGKSIRDFSETYGSQPITLRFD